MCPVRHSHLFAFRLVCLVCLPSCANLATSPAGHSPLREQLATADEPTVEEAVRACLGGGGWKVDPVGGLSGGANVVSAKNASNEQTQVFIQGPETHPRITGGPDYNDPFWKCLSGQLKSAKAAPAAHSDEN
jgi:hypothetical protein